MEQLGKDLEEAIGGQISLDITVVPAQEGVIDFDTAVTTTKIEESIRKAVKDLPIEILDIEAKTTSDGYEATAAVIEYQSGAITKEKITDLENSLSQEFSATIHIQIYAIPVEKLEGKTEKTPTPAPTATPAS